MVTIFLLILLLLGWLTYTSYETAVILVAALLPTYLLRTAIGPIPTTLLELSIITVAAVGAIQLRIRYQWRQSLRALPLPIWLASLGFVLAATISAYISAEPRVSWGIWKSWIITPMVFGWVVYAVANTVEMRQKIWRALQYSGLVVALIGLTQVFTTARIHSIYDVPNSLALFLVPIAVATIWQRQWLRSLILFLAIIATQSIGAVAALAVTGGTGYVFWRPDKKPARSVLISGLVICGLMIIYLSWSGRVSYLFQPLIAGTPTSSSVRVQLWHASVDLIKQHPWLGLGLDQFEPAYQIWLHQQFSLYQQGMRQSSPLPEFVFRDPHNWFLAMWLNLGVLGLLSWLVIHGYILISGYQQRQALARIDQATWLALLSLLLFGLVDTIYWKNDLAALQWLLIALCVRARG